MESKFTGSLLGLFGISILQWLVIIFTLGLGAPWAICIKESWIAEHTVIDGRRLTFDGTGMQLLGSYIKWWLLTVITCGIYGFWIVIKSKQWVVKHTHLKANITEASSSARSSFSGGLLGLIGVSILQLLITVLTLGLFYPAAVCIKEDWLARHTMIDGRRLVFDGTGMQLFGNYIKWYLLSIFTFGIYSLWIGIKSKQWVVKHTHFQRGCGEQEPPRPSDSPKRRTENLVVMSLASSLAAMLSMSPAGLSLWKGLCGWVFSGSEGVRMDRAFLVLLALFGILVVLGRMSTSQPSRAVTDAKLIKEERAKIVEEKKQKGEKAKIRTTSLAVFFKTYGVCGLAAGLGIMLGLSFYSEKFALAGGLEDFQKAVVVGSGVLLASVGSILMSFGSIKENFFLERYDEAMQLCNGGKKKEGFARCLALAEKGYPRAQTSVAKMYLASGDNDRRAAFWAMLGARDGGEGAALLGYIFEKGKGVSQNLELAKHWYQRAEQDGYSLMIAELEKSI